MKLTKLFSKVAISGLAFGALLMVSGRAQAAHVNNYRSPLFTRVSNNNNRIKPVHFVRSRAIRQSRIRVQQPVRTYHYQAANARQRNEDPHFRHVRKIAYSKLGDRYVWGAAGPHCFDCSGFTRYVYLHGAHKLLPRNAEAQREVIRHIARGHERRGDLAFFGHGTAAHVGLYLGRGKMIDAQLRGVVVERVHAPWWHLIGYGRP